MQRKTRRLMVVIAIVVILGLPALVATCAAPSKTEMVAMRDGTKLVTDVYLPQGEGRYPTVLMRTPYPRNGGDELTRLGFAVVIQSTRGRFGSEGKDMVFMDDGWSGNQDGYDTVEWIAAQPWSNGEVGTFGMSALGITQYMMAGSAPPHLKCQCAIVAASSLYDPIAHQGGALRKELIENWSKGNNLSADYLPTLRAHATYDAFCKSFDLSSRYDKVNAPAMHIGGWYDIFQQSTLDTFVGLQKRGGVGARGKQRLIMGPWIHGGPEQTGDFRYPRSSEQNTIIKSVEWLTYWLKDQGKADAPAVTYYTMGAVDEPGAPGNVWKTADSWPIPATNTPFYLSGGGLLSASRPAMKQGSRAYVFDPENPAPTVGGNNLTIENGPRDQRSVEARPDVLIFTTEPLKSPLEVTGRISVKLWASSSAKDTDFTAKLTDVYPDGRSMLVCDGIIRARYRDSRSAPRMMTPGKVYPFTIDLWSTSLVFNKGHRIRLAISSSNSPRFDVNPNTGEQPFEAKSRQKATNTVYLNAAHPSALVLPVVGH